MSLHDTNNSLFFKRYSEAKAKSITIQIDIEMYDFSPSPVSNWEKCLLISSGVPRAASFGGKEGQGGTREEDW